MSSEETEVKKVPFTILTGFLGAGKTTVLNRVLSHAGGNRIAVLVNELGRIDIDSRLILSRGGDVLELAGGCVCCKVDIKNDLWDGIADIIRRSKPDHVILETTGIAEPGAIIDGFRYIPDDQKDCVEPVGIVCVVEAEAGPRAIEEREEAREQIRCADRLLLSKLDLASAESLRALHACLDGLNTEAERASFPQGEDTSHALRTWIMEPRKVSEGRPHEHSHSQGQLAAISFADASPLLGERLLALVKRYQSHLFRVKGYVHIADEDKRGYIELAGDRVSLSFEEDWPEGVERTSEIVMIGSELDEAAIRRQLWACRAGTGVEAVETVDPYAD